MKAAAFLKARSVRAASSAYLNIMPFVRPESDLICIRFRLNSLKTNMEDWEMAPHFSISLLPPSTNGFESTKVLYGTLR